MVERTLIETRRSSCVASLKVVLVIDREVVWMAREKRKKKINISRLRRDPQFKSTEIV